MTERRSTEERTATLDYRVRFDEAGADGSVGPAWFLRIAQDAAWIHAERLGFTRVRYVAEGVAWLVRAVALDVRQPALHGERLSVTTRVVGYRRIWARRRTVVSREGVLVADVVTDWILLGSDGRPLRIPVEVVERLPGEDGPIEPIRVGIGPAPPSAIVVDDVIRPAELDPMGHVNNAAYLDRLMTLAGRVQPPPASAVLDRPSIRIEYAAAAGPDQPVRELAWPLEEGRGVAYRITAVDGSEIVRAILAGPVL